MPEQATALLAALALRMGAQLAGADPSQKFGHVNPLCYPLARARNERAGAWRWQENKAAADTAPCLAFSTKSPAPKERLRVSNWIVQRLYNYAVKKTVELRLLTVFQHVIDPTRVRTVADKNSAVTPLDLRPTVAD